MEALRIKPSGTRLIGTYCSKAFAVLVASQFCYLAPKRGAVPISFY